MTVVNPVAPTIRPSTYGDRAVEWWTQYCHAQKGSPGVRARLRRCDSAVQALAEPAAVSLARRLLSDRGIETAEDWRLEAAVNLARVLGHVTAHTPGTRPMRAAGWRSFPGERPSKDSTERPLLSDVRFRRLIETPRGEEQVTTFVRLIALLDDSTDIAAIADDFMNWGDRVKRRWAFDYYAVAIAAPTEPSTASLTQDDDV